MTAPSTAVVETPHATFAGVVDALTGTTSDTFGGGLVLTTSWCAAGVRSASPAGGDLRRQLDVQPDTQDAVDGLSGEAL